MVLRNSKFEILKNNTYRFRYLQGLNKQEEHFKNISDLAKNIEVIQLQRPNSPLQLQELADHFELTIG